MAPKIICAVILSVTVMTVYGFSEKDVGACSINNGVTTFSGSFLCDRTFYTAYIAGSKAENMTCQGNLFTCDKNGKITHTIKTFISGIEQPVEVNKLTDQGNGQLLREIPAANGVGTVNTKEIVVGWGEKKDSTNGNYFVLSTFDCNDKSNDDDLAMRMILVTSPDATLIDEVKQMKKALLLPGLYSIPFACQLQSLFPNAAY